jgi:integrase
LEKTRGWFWKEEENKSKFNRKSITRTKPTFPGWNVLLRLIHETENTLYYKGTKFLGDRPEVSVQEARFHLQQRDRGLLAATFELGSRIAEVVRLERNMFTVEEDRIVVKGVPIVKHWKKVGEILEEWEGVDRPSDSSWHWSYKFDNWVRRRYKTEPVFVQRNVLELPKFEPLIPYLEKWLDAVEKGFLFPSSRSEGYLSEKRCYQILRSLGEKIGLKKYDENGNVINLHVAPHTVRSWRASQLASEYSWRNFRLKQFFGWVSDMEPSRYATLAPAELFDSMRADRINAHSVK